MSRSCLSPQAQGSLPPAASARTAVRPVRKSLAILATLAMALGVNLAAAPAAHAAGITVSTPYPSLAVQPGETVSLELKVDSDPAQHVDLDVDAPKGWDTTLRGGGFVVNSVHADNAKVTLDVAVPDDAKGTHKVTVTARGADGSRDRLPLSLAVRGGGKGAIDLETEFAELSGSPTDTFSYSVTLRNDTARETRFALSAAGPSGWEVSAHPSTEQRATTVTVGPGATSTIEVSADPPDTATAGDYPIRLAVNGGGQEKAIDLVAKITGAAQLELATPDERLNASGSTGDETRVSLVVNNKGSAPLNNVTLTSSPPSGWKVTFEPETVNVAPQKSARVTAVITPADDAVTGDYMVTLTAEQDGQQSSTDIRFTVETSRWWGLAGILLIVAVGVGLWYVFRVYGRR